MKHGPNVKKLICHMMQNIRSERKAFKMATKVVNDAISRVYEAPDNPYKTDEEIAEAILKGIEDRNKEERNVCVFNDHGSLLG